MKSPPFKPPLRAGDCPAAEGPSLRRVVLKSALLNLAIVVTSLPPLVFAGGRVALVSILAIMAGITVIVWAATFSVYFFISLAQIFRAPTQHTPRRVAGHRSAVVDPWLDGPL